MTLPLSVLDTAPTPLWVIGDDDGTVRYCNAAGAALLGRPVSEVAGRRAAEVLPAPLAEFLEPIIREVRAGGAPMHAERPVPVLKRWFEVEVVPLPDGVAVFLRDTTAQHTRRMALEQSRATLARGQRIARIGSWSWEPSTGAVRWSEETFRLLGREDEATTGALSYDLVARIVHADDLPRMEAALARALTAAEPYDLELRMLTAQGDVLDVHVIGEVVRDADGRPTGMEGTMQDVSALRRAERALRESRGLLARAQAAARIASWQVRLDTMTVHWEPENWALWGQDPEQFVPSPATMMAQVHPDDVGRVAESTARAEREAGPLDFTVRIRTNTDEERHLRIVGDTVVDERTGTPTRIVGLTIDETERVRAATERLAIESKLQHAQRLESLGVLAGGIAHDFNNLLVGVLGNATLGLLDAPAGSPLHDVLHGIEQAAQRATDLTRQLLAYSGKGRFVLERVDLSTLVREMTSLVQASISKKTPLQLELTNEAAVVEGDITQLRQVVMNLLTNASEAMGERGGVLHVRTGVQEVDAHYAEKLMGGVTLVPGRYAFVEVSDTGHGIPAEQIPRIFEPFYTTKFTGRGLGLAATLGIVRGHLGGLRVYSEVGIGTTMRVLLPVTSGPVHAPAAGEVPATLAGHGLVLVVDDDASVRRVASQMLSRHGFTVLHAADGEEALSVIEARGDELRLLLLDLTMPRLGGEAVFERVRALRPRLPIIMMSGYNEQNVTQRFAGTPLAAFVQKPFTTAELTARIAEVLQD